MSENMRVGVSTRVFSCETECALEKIESSGAETADVRLCTFFEYRPEFSKAIKKGGETVEISSVRTRSENFEPNLLSRDRRIRGDGLYWLDQVLRCAMELGAKRVVLSFSPLSGSEDGADISGVSSLCERYGLEPCVSNAAGGLVSRPGDFSRLKKMRPTLRAALDLAEARRARFPYLMYIKDMGESLNEVFVSDFSESGPCLPGEGRTDFEEFFARLADIGFCGDVVADTPGGADEERIKRCVEYLKNLAEKAGF